MWTGEVQFGEERARLKVDCEVQIGGGEGTTECGLVR